MKYYSGKQKRSSEEQAEKAASLEAVWSGVTNQRLIAQAYQWPLAVTFA